MATAAKYCSSPYESSQWNKHILRTLLHTNLVANPHSRLQEPASQAICVDLNSSKTITVTETQEQ